MPKASPLSRKPATRGGEASAVGSAEPALPAAGRSRWRLWIAIIVLVGLVAGGWSSGQFARLCREQSLVTLKRGHFTAASNWLNRAIWLNGQTGATSLISARLARHRNQPAEVERWLALAQQKRAEPVDLRLEAYLAEVQFGRLSSLGPTIQHLLSDPREPDEAYLSIANLYLQNHRLPEAMAVLQQWAAEDPGSPGPHYLRGRMEEYDTNLSIAEDCYRRALELDRRHAPSLYNLGRLLISQQRYADADELFRRCEPLLENPGPALLGRGRAQRLSGNLAAARPVLESAAAAGEAAIDTYRWLGDPTESAISKPQFELGQLELDEERYSAAVAVLEQAVAANPVDWSIRFNYATALRGAGRREEAREQFAQVEQARSEVSQWDALFNQIRRDPHNAQARYDIGRIMLKHLSESQGLIWINSALDYDPELLPAHELLAQVYSDKSHRDPAYRPLADRHLLAVTRLNSRRAKSDPAVPQSAGPSEANSRPDASSASGILAVEEPRP